MEPAIFFAQPPSLDELCSITVSTEKINISSWPNATIQAHIVKCREVIFTEPDVICCPSCYSDNSFSVIMKQSFFKTGKLQSRLEKQGIQISKPFRVNFPLYQSCLKYTLIARLAPTWNKAGEWFIQGRDFLVHDGYSNAIKMDLCVNKDELLVSLTGTAIRFPPLQIEDLNLSKQEMMNILKATEGETDFAGCFCHVLPSMNRGRISSVSLTISRSSPFSSYKDLKRHWKNMYGYRLPETDEDVLYCQVGFLMSSCGKKFIYPNICLRSGPLQVIPRVDPKPILTIFLQDIHSRMTSVCGTSLRFQPKIRFAALSLHRAGQTCVKTGISLASKPQNKVTSNFRNVKNMLLVNRGSERDKKTMQERLYGSKSFSMESPINPTTVLLNDMWEKQEKSYSQSDEKTAAKLSHEVQDAAGKVSQKVIANATNVSPIRSDVVVTIAQPAEFVDGNVKQAKINANNTDNTQIICQPVSKTKDDEKSQESTTISMHEVGLETNHNFLQDIEETPKTKFVPIFRTKSKQSSSQKCSSSSINKRERENYVTSFIPSFKPKVIHNSNVSDKIPSGISSSLQVTSTNNCNNSNSIVALFKKPKKQPLPAHSASADTKNKDQSHLQQLPQPVTHKNDKNGVQAITYGGMRPINVTKSKEQMAPDLTNYRDTDNCTPKSSCVSKRKSVTEGDATPKKPRSKPQVHCLDVESLARANQLNKVNAVTLVAWLKERGVICKAKDKKPDLIERTKKYLNIVDTEP